jgi:hypothetical protein
MNDPHDIEREERAIYIIIAAACLPVVIGALMHGGALDVGATISLIIVVVALVGLVGLWIRSHRDRGPRVPRARIHGRRHDHASGVATPSRRR